MKIRNSAFAVLVTLVGLSSFTKASDPAISKADLCRIALEEPHNLKFREKLAIAQAKQAANLPLSIEDIVTLLNGEHLDKAGIFIEIGGGVKIVNHFYDAGLASSTVIANATPYSKELSNAFFTPATKGFVDEGRLINQLRVGYESIIKKVFIETPSKEYDPTKTRYFVIADTASTNESLGGHAWLGITYQASPLGELNTIRLHVRLLDPLAQKQSRALGALGVNLIWAAFQKSTLNLDDFARTLKNNLSSRKHGRVEIDDMHVAGPDFANYTDPEVAVTLLRNELTPTIIVDDNGVFLAPSQYFYKKDILLREIDSNLNKQLTPEEWQQAITTFAQITQSPLTDIREVNWLPVKKEQLEDPAKAVELNASIAKMKGAGVGVILSRLSGAGTIANWNKSLILKHVGIVYETAKFPTVDAYFKFHKRPVDPSVNITSQELVGTPYSLIVEVKQIPVAAPVSPSSTPVVPVVSK